MAAEACALSLSASIKEPVFFISRFSASSTLLMEMPIESKDDLFSSMNFFCLATSGPKAFQRSCNSLKAVICFPTVSVFSKDFLLTSPCISAMLLRADCAPKRLLVQLITSFPYTDSSVIPTTNAVCQLTMEDSTCFHTGTVAWFDFFSNSFSILAARILSAKMGRLLEMARKNMLAPKVSEGSSRATCCTDMERLLNPVPAERL